LKYVEKVVIQRHHVYTVQYNITESAIVRYSQVNLIFYMNYMSF